ncbi:MAG: ABC transporter ATP-binding protein [Anaerolineales bacterium]|nr:ABC transporter ATP-binding protein [Anaerolineales bacterium]
MIKTEEITKVYGMGAVQVRALDGVSLNIHEGEFVAIMGPSGSGKSTLMNIIGCLDRPTAGKYILASEDVSEMDKADLAHIRNRRIGFIFQAYNLLPRTSALDNVLLPMLYRRESHITEAEQKDKAIEMLEAVGLGDRIYHLPHEMSGGQTQRVAIARALINDPVIILADEPTGNLDSKSGEEIMTILSDLHAAGRTIVMVTHDQEIADFAERNIHFLDGHIDKDLNNGQLKGSKAKKAAKQAKQKTGSEPVDDAKQAGKHAGKEADNESS